MALSILQDDSARARRSVAVHGNRELNARKARSWFDGLNIADGQVIGPEHRYGEARA
jgi:hypothetical protein